MTASPTSGGGCRAACAAGVRLLAFADHPASGGAAAPRAAPDHRATGGGDLHLGPSVAPGTRPAIEQAIATARPEAQALIARVDGLTTLAAGVPSRSGAAGTTRPLLDGRFDVVLDTGGVYRRLGPRGINRLVLHELGHVVDLALLAAGLRARLDAGIPPGLPCPSARAPARARRGAERFAESFAKWAMRDIGVNLYIGYAVPPPREPRGLGRAARSARRVVEPEPARQQRRAPRRAPPRPPAARPARSARACTRRTPAWRSLLRSTRATSRSPSRNGST